MSHKYFSYYINFHKVLSNTFKLNKQSVTIFLYSVFLCLIPKHAYFSQTCIYVGKKTASPLTGGAEESHKHDCELRPVVNPEMKVLKGKYHLR